jgi:O-antigen/teichoic acid export membrane protein
MQPNRNLTASVVKNASANVVRLAASGVVALLLTPFLVRKLPTDTYSAWALLLQLTLYVGLLDFGIQTAVARFVAHADELGDSAQRDGIVSTATVLLAFAGGLAFSVIALLSWQLPTLFPAMPANLYRGARIALLLMGGSFALGLPFSVIQAIFVGFHRNEIPAAIVIFNRFAMAALVITGVLYHRGLIVMGAAVAIANVASYIGSYVAWRRWAGQVKIRLSSVSRKCGQKIAGYSFALAVWLAGMLMVSGLDLTVVAKFDYAATAYYAVAATLTNFVAQAQGAIFAALLPASAVLSARGDAAKLGDVLINATRYGMLILLAMALPLMAAGKLILRLWVGASYATHSTAFLQVLLLGNVVRLSALPYATLLLGTNQQKKVIVSPLAEGITNLSVSVVGAYFFGAMGVAIGTLIGSFVGLGLHVVHNMPRTVGIAVKRSEFVTQGLLRPLICAAPVCLLLLFRVVAPTVSGWDHWLSYSVTTLATVFLFLKFGLLKAERRYLLFRLSTRKYPVSPTTNLKAANG